MVKIAFAAALLAALPLACLAQAYPSKPIRIVLSVEPGASTNDILTRGMAERLSRELKVNVLIDNRPGAHGNIGMPIAAKAIPDGYTIAGAYSGIMSLNPSMYTDLTYDPDKDFAPIARFSTVPYVIVINPNVKANTLKEFIALAKTMPGKMNYASSGIGGTPHLATEMLKMQTGIDLVHIPYKAAAGATVDQIAGKVELQVTGITGVIGPIKAGKLRALAVTTDNRSALLPDVPTAKEAGLNDYEVGAWLGYVAPAKVPPAIINTLYQAMAKVTNTPDTAEFLARQGAEAALLAPAEFKKYMTADRQAWGKVIKALGIKGE